MLLLYLQLFWTFFQIGLFGFGGGYAMISMIQAEVVGRHGWLTSGQLADIVAVSQSTPGPIGINSATYVGYVSVLNAGYAPGWAVLGSAVATGALVLPSVVLMLLVCRFLLRYKHHQAVEHTFSGLRPAVVGLLAAAALLLMTEENFGHPATHPRQFAVSVALFVFTFVAHRMFKVNPVLLLCICGVCGLFLF